MCHTDLAGTHYPHFGQFDLISSVRRRDARLVYVNSWIGGGSNRKWIGFSRVFFGLREKLKCPKMIS
jgi:hypothetical protein